MKKIILTAAVSGTLALVANAQQQKFLPNHLAVLRAGDGVVNLHLKQAPIFVDQFDPAGMNDAPSFTVAIPSKGSNALFFNGHAATEGNLSRSADRTLLAFAGYSTDLFQTKGTPSQLEIPRGFCTIDAAGNYTLVHHGTDWYGKTNPRGVVTDGTNHFWGCGNAAGTVYLDAKNAAQPVQLVRPFSNTREVKIVNNVLYASMNGPDGAEAGSPAGIYDYTEGEGTPAGLPHRADAAMHLVIPAAAAYTANVGFDINPAGTIAYMSDTISGVQKYVKTNGDWKFAYNFSIPQSIPKALNHATGCFGLVVDFSGPAPIIYSTTMEGYGSMNSNRVVRIVDTDPSAAVTTIAQAASTNIVYRGITFTPEARSSP
jgi:hypothetical protein